VKRCLLVDDNRPLAENLGEILEAAGHAVVLAADRTQAVACVRREQFDVLITDLRLPRVRGAELLGELRQIDPGLPTIAVTAYSSGPDVAQASAKGLLALLSKPVPVDRLIHLVSVAKRNGLAVLATDDAALASWIPGILAQEGYTVVSTPLDVLARALELDPFLVLLDVGRAGAGRDAARFLIDRHPRLPRLLLVDDGESAFSKSEQVLCKPLVGSTLLAAVGRCYRGGPHAA
jgi:CheY-like chemotaxis protein